MSEIGATTLLQPPACGRTFTATRRVRLSDVSPQGRARLDALARYLQDIARDDSADAEFPDPMAWVVRRTLIEVASAPRFQEMLELTTWCSGFGGRWAERRTRMTGNEGAAVEAASIWVHVDLRTGTPRRLPDEFHNVWGTAAAGRRVSARLLLSEVGKPEQDTTPERTSQYAPGAEPRAEGEHVPQAAPRQAPGAEPRVAPRQAPGAEPRVAPRQAPGAEPKAAPLYAPGAELEAAPDSEPGATSDATPGATSDMVPDVIQVPWLMRAGDLDVMNHMNNAAHWAAVVEALSFIGMPTHRVRVELEHVLAVAPQSHTSLWAKSVAGGADIWMQADGLVATAARVRPLGSDQIIEPSRKCGVGGG